MDNINRVYNDIYVGLFSFDVILMYYYQTIVNNFVRLQSLNLYIGILLLLNLSNF